MKRTILAGACSALVMGGILTVAMLKPQTSNAFTLNPAGIFVFPQVTVSPGQQAKLCVSNMGDGSVDALIGLLNVLDTSRTTSSTSMTFGPHQGTCILLPAIRAAGVAGTAPTAEPDTTIAIIAVLTKGKAYENLNSSLQIMNPTGTQFVLSPSFNPNLLVPAVTPVP
jgi:hypothetical protein